MSIVFPSFASLERTLSGIFSSDVQLANALKKEETAQAAQQGERGALAPFFLRKRPLTKGEGRDDAARGARGAADGEPGQGSA
jgi:hypothetical protein